MRKTFRIAIRTFLLVPITAFLLLCTLIVLLHTPWGQKKIARLVNTEFAKHQIPLKISGLGGNPPFYWTIRRIDYQVASRPIVIEDIKLQIAPLSLLKGKLELLDISIKAQGQATLSGRFDIDLYSHLIEGSLYGQIHKLNAFFPDTSIDGSMGVQCDFSHNGAEQNLELNFLCKHLRHQQKIIDDLSLSIHLGDLYHMPEGSVDCVIEDAYTPQIFFQKIAFEMHSSPEGWPFSLQIDTPKEIPNLVLNSPNYFWITGLCKWEKENISVTCDKGEGVLLQMPIALTAPCTLRLKRDFLELTPCRWNVSLGSIEASASFTPDHTDLHLQMAHLPLKIVQLFKPQLFLDGTLTAEGFLEGPPQNLQGVMNIVLEKAELTQSTQNLSAKGSLQAHLNHQTLQIHTYLHAAEDQFLDFSCSLPLHNTSSSPFSMRIDPFQPIAGSCIIEGRIQDLFDFVNTGTHHFSGFLSAHLLFSNTWSHPYLQGDLFLQQGIYENYYTGTWLKEIEAHFRANRQTLSLLEMKAKDDLKGTLTAIGVLKIDPQEHYPYKILSQLNQAHLIRFDTIDCQLTGPLNIHGNTKSAKASGSLLVPVAHIHIPDHLPYNLPQLPVEFINYPAYLTSSSPPPSPIFPFHIDLNLTAYEGVHVEGKGLTSEWQGAVHLRGTNADIAPEGTLSLIKGEYLFSGNRFNLTEGNIVFKDKPFSNATIALSGNLNLSNAEITAQLRGPLSAPQLTFHSNPQMTTSAILAKVLFKKDLSDISHPEALQLANTLVSLSGGTAPDVLEAIRKSIGVDRLTIVSDPGSDQIALQIGKYLTKGVLITLSQSPTSSQIIVEVELSKGFIFQAETQEEEEGKFSLKWRRSY